MRCLLLVMGVVLCVAIGTACMALTPQERALRTAKEAVQKEGIVVGEADIVYDSENKRWEERVVAIAKLPADPNHGKLPHGVLYNKKYETVLFDFKEGAKYADTWVFIDKNTGDALAIYQEK